MNPKFEFDRAEVLDWRNTERLTVVHGIKSRLPDIDVKINELIEKMSTWDTVRRTRFHDREIAPIVEEWLQQLLTDFKQGIEESAAQSEQALGNNPKDYSWSWGEVATAGAATAATLAPLAVLPFATSIATFSATSFLLITTSAVSIPVLTVVVGGALAAGVGGEKLRRYAFSRITSGYRKQVRDEIWKKAMGDTKNLEAPSACRALLAEIDMIALKRLENLQ
jgi:uncharacterized membrane-anchored protein